MNKIKTYLAQAALTPDTKDTYRRNLGYFASWWNSKPASEVTPEDFAEFLSAKTTWGDSQQHTALAAFKSYIRTMYGEKDETNRTREILLFKVKRKEPPEQRTLTLDEVEKLLASCDLRRSAHQRDYVMLLIAWDCRLRAKEVCNLKISQIHFEDRTIVTGRKGGKQKAGLFGEVTSAYLQAWLRERQLIARPGVDEVFVNIQGKTRGTRMRRSHWRVTCRRWAIRAGIPHFSPHALCRSFAYLSTKAGAPEHLIELAGGWDDGGGMVKRYTKRLRVLDFEPYLPSNQLRKKGEPPVTAEGSRGSDRE